MNGKYFIKGSLKPSLFVFPFSQLSLELAIIPEMEGKQMGKANTGNWRDSVSFREAKPPTG